MELSPEALEGATWAVKGRPPFLCLVGTLKTWPVTRKEKYELGKEGLQTQ